jgi:hypothetical protein
MVDRTPEERRAYFLEQLRIGDKWADHVADMIMKAGKPAYATPTKVAQSEAEIQEFTRYEKDIILSDNRSLEVKSRSFAFTGVESYPYETVFVDTVEGWAEKVVKPVAVAVVSQRTGGIVMVPISSAAVWSEKRIYDSKRCFEVNVLECPRSALKSFEEFLAWL